MKNTDADLSNEIKINKNKKNKKKKINKNKNRVKVQQKVIDTKEFTKALKEDFKTAKQKIRETDDLKFLKSVEKMTTLAVEIYSKILNLTHKRITDLGYH